MLQNGLRGRQGGTLPFHRPEITPGKRPWAKKVPKNRGNYRERCSMGGALAPSKWGFSEGSATWANPQGPPPEGMAGHGRTGKSDEMKNRKINIQAVEPETEKPEVDNAMSRRPHKPEVRLGKETQARIGELSADNVQYYLNQGVPRPSCRPGSPAGRTGIKP